ncbi:hypothetical protein N7470_000174 [Penicillium chermesinum]|nr:hypothetical protein N7470_000174 [Penicillium chermesinum]
MKCTFALSTDKACTRCQRRGAKCVSQEFPEQVSSSMDRSLQMGDRIVRVEALVEQLLAQGSKESGSGYPSAQKSNDTVGMSILSDNSQPEISSAEKAPGGQKDMKKISQSLYDALPISRDIEMIIKGNGNTSTFFYQMLVTPYDRLDRNKTLEDVFSIPSPRAHPVLIARLMLHIVTFLQHLHPEFYGEIEGLSEAPQDMKNRLVDVALTFISANDELISCVEGLDALMVGSWYQANDGRLRKGLITIRRAMTIAQLMGFHRSGSLAKCDAVDEKTRAYPEVIWFRILSIERYICLMLGLPQASLDKSMASDSVLAKDTPMSRLDRIHCAITSRVLERNQSDPSPQDYTLTRELDGELQKAAAYLPSRWWLIPNLANTAADPEGMFWDMRRIFHQLFHYNLLIHIHLPYILCPSADGQKHEYSRITCVNAAREVLSRFLMFQSFNRIAFCCRTVNYFCLAAAMTLLLAHIDGRKRSPAFNHAQGLGQQMSIAESLLAHQRPSDRALVEQAQESMEEISRLYGDALSVQTADLLRRLMEVESEVASGQSCRVEGSDQKPPGDNEMRTTDNGGVLQISMPHFGSINITREGVVSKDSQRIPKSQAQSMHGAKRNIPFDPEMGNKMPKKAMDRETTQSFTKRTDSLSRDIPASTSTDPADFPAQGHQAFNDISQVPLQEVENNVNIWGVDEWAFEGIDLAFFDTLMRGAGEDTTDWPAWMNDS